MAEQPPGASADPDPAHPLLVSLRPLLDRVGGRVVPVRDARTADVPLVWEGQVVAAVRLPLGAGGEAPAGGPGTGSSMAGSSARVVADLDLLLAEVAQAMGGPLSGLGRAERQHAVRLLEERGAFGYRKSAESIAEALGVTRFTVYNYRNRNRG